MLPPCTLVRHVCMSRVQTFVCLRKKNDSKCNETNEEEGKKYTNKHKANNHRDLNVWMEFIRVSSNKWSKNQDLCTFIIKFSRVARLFFVSFQMKCNYFPRFTWSLCGVVWRCCCCCLGISICILIVSSVFAPFAVPYRDSLLFLFLPQSALLALKKV